eukprot:TRINITY_DN6427_c0_g3_i2.p1 TRINITY_DN6427_c0_g3~~TRINITY_DN6427_c0_g3_i2.p1  ORF type:complete len:1199 (+),score=259.76 TRINITY_DN6427_c0_g3_i2:172-3768(+)
MNSQPKAIAPIASHGASNGNLVEETHRRSSLVRVARRFSSTAPYSMQPSFSPRSLDALAQHGSFSALPSLAPLSSRIHNSTDSDTNPASAADAVEEAIKDVYDESKNLILVVGNERMTSQAVYGQLKQLSVQAELIETGADALKLCASRTIDMLLVSVQLPDMEGLAFLQVLRNQLKVQSPIIFLSISVGTIMRQQALKSGAVDVIQTPISTEYLGSIVGQVLRISWLSDRHQRLVSLLKDEHESRLTSNAQKDQTIQNLQKQANNLQATLEENSKLKATLAESEKLNAQLKETITRLSFRLALAEKGHKEVKGNLIIQLNEKEKAIDDLKRKMDTAIETPLQSVVRTVAELSELSTADREKYRNHLVTMMKSLTSTDMFAPPLDQFFEQAPMDELTKSWMVSEFTKDRPAKAQLPRLPTNGQLPVMDVVDEEDDLDADDEREDDTDVEQMPFILGQAQHGPSGKTPIGGKELLNVDHKAEIATNISTLANNDSVPSQARVISDNDPKSQHASSAKSSMLGSAAATLGHQPTNGTGQNQSDPETEGTASQITKDDGHVIKSLADKHVPTTGIASIRSSSGPLSTIESKPTTEAAHQTSTSDPQHTNYSGTTLASKVKDVEFDAINESKESGVSTSQPQEQTNVEAQNFQNQTDRLAAKAQSAAPISNRRLSRRESRSSRLKELSPNLDQYKLETFSLFSFTDDDLIAIVPKIFDDFGLLSEFQIRAESVIQFTKVLRRRYLPNPYHTFRHAIDVLQTCYMFLQKNPVLDNCLTPLCRLALFIAALGHDLEHPGVNNAFQINVISPLALTYNDRSVLENHHSACTFSILQDPGCDLLHNLTSEQYRTARKIIIDIILSTDMSVHFEICSKLSARLNTQPFFRDTLEDQILLMSVILHAADISNVAKPPEISKIWGDKVLEEFLLQGDQERSKGLPISPYMDRNNTSQAKMILGFIDFMVMPLFNSLFAMSPDGMSFYRQNLLLNRRNWGGDPNVEDPPAPVPKPLNLLVLPSDEPLSASGSGPGLTPSSAVSMTDETPTQQPSTAFATPARPLLPRSPQPPDSSLHKTPSLKMTPRHQRFAAGPDALPSISRASHPNITTPANGSVVTNPLLLNLAALQQPPHQSLAEVMSPLHSAATDRRLTAASNNTSRQRLDPIDQSLATAKETALVPPGDNHVTAPYSYGSFRPTKTVRGRRVAS